jgi:hypothetical protein
MTSPTPRRIIAELPRLTPMLSAQLAAALYTARHPVEALVRLRAIQAALSCAGLLLDHEPRRATLPGPGLGCPLTPRVADTINRVVSTGAAAAAVLHLVYPTGFRYPVSRSSVWRLAPYRTRRQPVAHRARPHPGTRLRARPAARSSALAQRHRRHGAGHGPARRAAPVPRRPRPTGPALPALARTVLAIAWVRADGDLELEEALASVEEAIPIYRCLATHLPRVFAAELRAACRTQADVLEGLGRMQEADQLRRQLDETDDGTG